MKYFKHSFLIVLSLFFASCLNSDLDDVPTFDEAEILNIKFEHRWAVEEGISEKLRVQSMETSFHIDDDTKVITCEITVPAAGGEFNETIRDQVSLSNLVGYTSISPAATIIPLDNSTVLGTPGDWTQLNEYLVKAADGSEEIWTIEIVEFYK